VTAESLEDAMIVYAHEFALFSNRDKFDLVAICDDTSTSFGSATSPASILVRAISEMAFKKMLKRMPMLLVGGIQAYKKEVGIEEIVLGNCFLCSHYT
jgi:ubiquitin carboxyl-terminal hydrolase 8